MAIETRPIQEQDYREILAVAEALPEWFDADARGRAIPADLRHQHGFVALSGGQVVGFITLFLAEGRLNIGWLGVRPDFHRKGIGSRLLDCAEEFAKHHGLTEIATYTLGDGVDYKPYEATRRFYFSRGFKTYQRSTTDNPGCPEEIKIKKPIAHSRVPGDA
ncbi:MAG: GNAT family N-acetyltransferase [Candidatus Hydrogenedentes bacterium]|nr:GNAT family N-acetyltransferase [Candidatus Hydrogenedentota bacterium]